MVSLHLFLPPLSQPWRECFPAPLPLEQQQPSGQAEQLQARKALTPPGGRERDYCSPLPAARCRRGRGRAGIRRPEPRAGPAACRLLPAPFLPRRSPHGPGSRGSAGLGGASRARAHREERSRPSPPLSAGRRGRRKDALPKPSRALRSSPSCSEPHLVLRIPPPFPFFHSRSQGMP